MRPEQDLKFFSFSCEISGLRAEILPTVGFSVGPWQVIPDLHELRQGATVRRIQPRLMALLVCLAERPGQTWTREALLDRVWSRRVLNDEVLSRSIADLRQALDDDARAPRFVETIPKLGYRLVAEVRSFQDRLVTAPDSLPMAQPTPAPRLWTDRWPGLRVAWLLALLLVLPLGMTLWWRTRAPTPGATPALVTQILMAQPLTSTVGAELRPRFAQSAPWLAYSRQSADGASLHLWMRSRDGTVLRQLTEGAVHDLCPMFADGDRLLYFNRYAEGRCQLMRLPVVGGPPQALGTCGFVLSCGDLSVDGQWWVHTAVPATDRQAAGLARLHLVDGRVEPLTQPSVEEGDDVEPRFSPWDAGRLVFQRGREGESRLWQLRGSGVGAVVQSLPLESGMHYGSAWLQRDQLLLASDLSGFRALQHVDLGSGVLTLLGARGARYPTRAADGSLAWELASYDANLWAYRRSQTAPERLTPSARYDAYPRLSPDGRLLAYQSNREGNELIYLLDLVRGTEQLLPLDRRYRWAHPAWSSDGRTLWLTCYGDNGTELWRWTLGAAEPARWNVVAVGSHDAMPDPQHPERLWFLRGEGVAAALYHQDGAAPPRLLAASIAQYEIKPDALYLVHSGTDQIQRCPPPNLQQCTPLPGVQLAPGQDRNWTVSARAVWFAPPGSRTLMRHDLAAARSAASDAPVGGALTRAVAVSADESLIVVARLDALEVDLHWAPPPSQP